MWYVQGRAQPFTVRAHSLDEALEVDVIHSRTRLISRARSALVRDVARFVVVVGAFVFGSAESCLGDDPPEVKPCTAQCAKEADCGFRSEEDCLKTSCNDDGTPKDQAADDCLAAAADCLVAASCACEGGCSRVDECTEGEPNAACVGECDTLVEQLPEATYQENRCRIEKDCADLATCSSVN